MTIPPEELVSTLRKQAELHPDCAFSHYYVLAADAIEELKHTVHMQEIMLDMYD